MKTQSKFVDKQQTGVFFSCFENFAVSSFADFRENFIDFNSSFAPLTLKIIFTMLKNTFLTKKKEKQENEIILFVIVFYMGLRMGLSGDVGLDGEREFDL